MSDKKAPASSGTGNSQKDLPHAPQSSAPPKTGPKSNFAKAADTSKQGGNRAKAGNKTADKKTPPSGTTARTAKKGRGWAWLWLILLVLIAAAVAAWYLAPGVRQQVKLQLQGLPLVGKYFYANTGSNTDSARAQTAKSSPAEPASTDANSPSHNASARTGTSSRPVAQTQPAPSAPEPSTPGQPVPEQPILQPGESRPSPSSPTAPNTTPPQVNGAEKIGELRQQFTQQLNQQSQIIQQLQQQLAGLQRNVTAQGNRLSQLGNASREDWQLAEADYLLRLANQRLMLEKDSRAALGLLQEVDTIVRDVDLPDLYGVRQQLARDITALKLAPGIDRDGLYLRLRALEEQMVKLNIQPKFDLPKQEAKAVQAEVENKDVGEAHFRASWDNFLNFLKSSVRIRDGEIDPVLLSPQSEIRFRQSLRLNMEQAELALLRADDTVYKDTLTQASQLLKDYGTDNPQRQAILGELQELAQEKITVDLPNLSASQSALRNYIDKMHKVSSGQSPSAANGGSIQ